MATGLWRLGIGRTTVVLVSNEGEEREVEVASGEPPTGSDLANRIAGNWARYEEDADAIRCFDGFGEVAWVSGPAPPETVIAEWQPQAIEAPVGLCDEAGGEECPEADCEASEEA